MKVTLSIIVICLAVLIAQALVPDFTLLVALTPTLAFGGMYWQFITYMFAHGDINHFGFNMLGLFIFGNVVERFLGVKRFLLLYFVSGIGSAMFHLLLTGMSDIPMLGASGAVYAVVTAYAFKFPNNKLIIFPIPVPVKAVYVIIGFIAFSVFAGVTGIFAGIAHFGHLGGILVGAAIMYYWRRTEKKEPLDGYDWIWETW